MRFIRSLIQNRDILLWAALGVAAIYFSYSLESDSYVKVAGDSIRSSDADVVVQRTGISGDQSLSVNRFKVNSLGDQCFFVVTILVAVRLLLGMVFASFGDKKSIAD